VQVADHLAGVVGTGRHRRGWPAIGVPKAAKSTAVAARNSAASRTPIPVGVDHLDRMATKPALNELREALLLQSERLRDRFAILQERDGERGRETRLAGGLS
jgi:hypothetical protein